MPVSVDTPTVEAPDRNVLASHALCEALSLGALKPKELKQLATALAEAATAEIAINVDFRERILSTFQALTLSTSKGATSNKKGKTKSTKPEPTPIRQVDAKLLGPDKPLDPYLLQYAYGDGQLRDVLDWYPASELKKAAALVEQRNPGTKPTNRSQKGALLDYIISQVTG